MLKNIKRFLKGFSVVEILVTVVATSVVLAAFTPVITKKITVGKIQQCNCNYQPNSLGQCACPLTQSYCESVYGAGAYVKDDGSCCWCRRPIPPGCTEEKIETCEARGEYYETVSYNVDPNCCKCKVNSDSDCVAQKGSGWCKKPNECACWQNCGDDDDDDCDAIQSNGKTKKQNCEAGYTSITAEGTVVTTNTSPCCRCQQTTSCTGGAQFVNTSPTCGCKYPNPPDCCEQKPIPPDCQGCYPCEQTEEEANCKDPFKYNIWDSTCCVINCTDPAKPDICGEGKDAECCCKKKCGDNQYLDSGKCQCIDCDKVERNSCKDDKLVPLNDHPECKVATCAGVECSKLDCSKKNTACVSYQAYEITDSKKSGCCCNKKCYIKAIYDPYCDDPCKGSNPPAYCNPDDDDSDDDSDDDDDDNNNYCDKFQKVEQLLYCHVCLRAKNGGQNGPNHCWCNVSEPSKCASCVAGYSLDRYVQQKEESICYTTKPQYYGLFDSTSTREKKTSKTVWKKETGTTCELQCDLIPGCVQCSLKEDDACLFQLTGYGHYDDSTKAKLKTKLKEALTKAQEENNEDEIQRIQTELKGLVDNNSVSFRTHVREQMKCDTCNTGYVKKDDKTCVKCPSGCEKCKPKEPDDYDNLICTECKAGYRPGVEEIDGKEKAGQCVPCQTGCSECRLDNSKNINYSEAANKELIHYTCRATKEGTAGNYDCYRETCTCCDKSTDEPDDNTGKCMPICQSEQIHGINGQCIDKVLNCASDSLISAYIAKLKPNVLDFAMYCTNEETIKTLSFIDYFKYYGFSCYSAANTSIISHRCDAANCSSCKSGNLLETYMDKGVIGYKCSTSSPACPDNCKSCKVAPNNSIECESCKNQTILFAGSYPTSWLVGYFIYENLQDGSTQKVLMSGPSGPSGMTDAAISMLYGGKTCKSPAGLHVYMDVSTANVNSPKYCNFPSIEDPCKNDTWGYYLTANDQTRNVYNGSCSATPTEYTCMKCPPQYTSCQHQYLCNTYLEKRPLGGTCNWPYAKSVQHNYYVHCNYCGSAYNNSGTYYTCE